MAEPIQEVCIANIGPKQRRHRLNGGILTFSIGIALTVALIFVGTPVWLRLLAFLPFVAGASGFWQYQEKT